MKASEHVQKMNELIMRCGDLDLVYSTDDEGNDFKKVYQTPSVGNFEDGDFISVNSEDFSHEDMRINSICIN